MPERLKSTSSNTEKTGLESFGSCLTQKNTHMNVVFVSFFPTTILCSLFPSMFLTQRNNRFDHGENDAPSALLLLETISFYSFLFQKEL